MSLDPAHSLFFGQPVSIALGPTLIEKPTVNRSQCLPRRSYLLKELPRHLETVQVVLIQVQESSSSFFVFIEPAMEGADGVHHLPGSGVPIQAFHFITEYLSRRFFESLPLTRHRISTIA